MSMQQTDQEQVAVEFQSFQGIVDGSALKLIGDMGGGLRKLVTFAGTWLD